MEPISTATALMLVASLISKGVGAGVSASESGKRGKEIDKDIEKAEDKLGKVGVNQAQRAIQEAKVLGPLAGIASDAKDKGDSLLAATETSSGKDLSGMHRDITRERMRETTRAKREIDDAALNRAEDEKRRIEAEIAGLRAAKLGYQSDSTDAMLGLLGGVGTDFATLAAAPEEAKINLTPDQESRLRRVLDEYTKNPEAVQKALDAVGSGIPGEETDDEFLQRILQEQVGAQ